MSTITLIIDRIEGPEAVVEYDKKYYSLPLEMLPEGISEGDSLTISRSPPDETILEQAESRLERLKKRDSGSQIIDL